MVFSVIHNLYFIPSAHHMPLVVPSIFFLANIRHTQQCSIQTDELTMKSQNYFIIPVDCCCYSQFVKSFHHACGVVSVRRCGVIHKKKGQSSFMFREWYYCIVKLNIGHYVCNVEAHKCKLKSQTANR